CSGTLATRWSLKAEGRARRLPAAIPSSMPGMLAALTYLRGSACWHRSTPCAENVDHGAWSANLPVTQRIEIDGFRIYVLHILPNKGISFHGKDRVELAVLHPVVPRHEAAIYEIP